MLAPTIPDGPPRLLSPADEVIHAQLLTHHGQLSSGLGLHIMAGHSLTHIEHHLQTLAIQRRQAMLLLRCELERIIDGQGSPKKAPNDPLIRQLTREYYLSKADLDPEYKAGEITEFFRDADNKCMVRSWILNEGEDVFSNRRIAIRKPNGSVYFLPIDQLKALLKDGKAFVHSPALTRYHYGYRVTLLTERQSDVIFQNKQRAQERLSGSRKDDRLESALSHYQRIQSEIDETCVARQQYRAIQGNPTPSTVKALSQLEYVNRCIALLESGAAPTIQCSSSALGMAWSVFVRDGNDAGLVLKMEGRGFVALHASTPNEPLRIVPFPTSRMILEILPDALREKLREGTFLTTNGTALLGSSRAKAIELFKQAADQNLFAPNRRRNWAQEFIESRNPVEVIEGLRFRGQSGHTSPEITGYAFRNGLTILESDVTKVGTYIVVTPRMREVLSLPRRYILKNMREGALAYSVVGYVVHENDSQEGRDKWCRNMMRYLP